MVSDNVTIEVKGLKEASVDRIATISSGPTVTSSVFQLQAIADDFAIYDYIKHNSTEIVKAYDNWCTSNLIKKVIFSDPCTIVIWADGTKTIVRCTDEKFDKEKGLAMCIAKKSLGNKGKYYDIFKKWIEEEEK